MSELLDTAAAEAVKKVVEYLDKGVGFALSQAPDIAREYILWGRVTCILEIVAALTFPLIARRCFRRAGAIVKERGDAYRAYRSDAEIPWFIAGGTLSVVSGIFFLSALSNSRAWIVPKVYLISKFIR